MFFVLKAIEYLYVVLLVLVGMALSTYLPRPGSQTKEPTVIAIDINSFTVAAAKKGAKQAVNEAIMNIQTAAQKLADQGFIVIKSDNVLAAPEGYIITADKGK